MEAINKILIILLFFTIALSCKTTKTVQKLDSAALQKKDVKSEVKLSSVDSLKITFSTNNLKVDSTTELITEYRLSIPDSTGKQYITVITYTDKNNKSVLKSNVRAILNQIKSTDSIVNITDKTSNKITTNSNVKTKIKSKVNWLGIVGGICFCILLLLLILRLKRN